MSNQIEPSDSVENYLQHKLGVSQSMAGAILRAITEWISLKLRRREPAIMPYIGKIVLGITSQRKRLKYYPGKTLQNRINAELYKESSFLIAIKEIRQKLGLQLQKEAEVVIELEEELRTERKPKVKDQQDVLRYKLIYYFQRHYPHKLDWQHPVTHKNYPWQTIYNNLYIIKKSSWRDYRILLTTLVRIDDRRYLLKRWKMTKTEYNNCLQRALDALLMLLEFPELSDTEVTSILESDKRFKL